jgi:hypothetical protein
MKELPGCGEAALVEHLEKSARVVTKIALCLAVDGDHREVEGLLITSFLHIHAIWQLAWRLRICRRLLGTAPLGRQAPRRCLHYRLGTLV